MTFTSTIFLVFCSIFFPLYYLTIERVKLNNFVVCLGSLAFYGWYQHWFLMPMAASAVTDFSLALIIANSSGALARRLLLMFAIVINIGLLGYFKYGAFLLYSLDALIGAMRGGKFDLFTNVVLPAGISFYTFQSLSYTIDVYKREIVPTRSFVSFLGFVSFFPHLVAGPIMRAKSLLPQIETRRHFDIAVAEDGIRQTLWGLAKKMIVADNLADVVEKVYSVPTNYTAPLLAVATVFFAFQIYADFSGYSDIANGLAKMLGFRLIQNFRYPYFSLDIVDFWRRWHISLTSWFRDYVYSPLGGSRSKTPRWMLNVLIVFLISGLWHGANWTFVAWGAIHALAYLIVALSHRRQPIGNPKTGFSALVCRLITFGFVCLTWVIFRAPDIPTAWWILRGFATPSFWVWMPDFFVLVPDVLQGAVVICALLALEWRSRDVEHPFSDVNWSPLYRRLSYVALTLAIVLLGAKNETRFLYFQF